MKTLALTTLFAFASLTHADTVIHVDDTVLRTDTRRFGICLAQHNYYDSHQMMKELLFRNPGFEGLLYQSIVRLGSGGTATSAIEDQLLGQWPTGFWAGAQYEIIWSSAGAKGRSGTLTTNIAPNRANPPNDPSGSTLGTTYVFDPPAGAVPASGDYLLLRKQITGSGGGAASGSWDVTTQGGGMITSETSDLPPGTLGQQCVRLTALSSGQQATISGRFDTLQGFVRLNGQFRLAFKAKGVGGANRAFVTVRRGSSPHLSQTVQLTSDWADYTLPFTAAESDTVSGTVSVEFSATGQSALLLDDVSLRQTDSDAGNPTEFRDGVVAALRELKPGILRYPNWQMLGNSLDNDLAPVFARRRSGYSVYGTNENNMLPGLHEFLVLCEHLGADPWMSVPSTSSPQEMTNLMEYLGGATSTPYGQVRAARGHAAPWTGVFSRIHLEFGNEHWNNTAYRGGAISTAVPCGARADELFGAIKASPHYSAAQVNCILGGQSGNPASAIQFHNASSLHDTLTLAPYMSGRVDSYAGNEELFGPLFAEPEWWSYNPSPTSGLMRHAFNQVQASSRPVPLSVYEVNLHTTSGAISQTALDSYTPSLGAALAVADHMLVMLRELGTREQCMMSLAGHRYTWPDSSGKTAALWGVTLDMDKTHRRRPTFHALSMLNDVLGGDLLLTQHSGEDPTWSINNMNRVTFTNAHHLQSHAFQNGTQRGLIVFNLHRTSALDVRFTGPNAPAGTLTLRRLNSANITDNNETAEVVTPTTQTLTSFDPAQPLSLPPYSMTVLQWTPPARQAWRYQNFGTVASTGSAADDADPDGDGLSNLLEYAIGTLPTQTSPSPWSPSTASGYLGLSIAKNAAASGVTWSAESSDDLTNWHPEQTVTLIDNATTFTVRDSVPVGAATRRFLRLRVTAVP
jgi:alpha-L-arabinofuranosidase